MRLSTFDYTLPANLIAAKPATPRDHSRLLILNRKNGAIKHDRFFNLPDYLTAGDVLVLNNTKVFPARLWGHKDKSGGKTEVLLIKNLRNNIWEALISARRVNPGLVINFKKGLTGKILSRQNNIFTIRFNKTKPMLSKIIEQIGEPPIPPYIKNYPGSRSQLLQEYQTIYANKRKSGSVAAPTAGLHFTRRLLQRLAKQGVQIEYLTLHVGYGTFQPVKTEKIEDHRLHPEWIEIKHTTANRLNQAKAEGRRIIPVGTTALRALEAASDNKLPHKIKAKQGYINIFIYPGYKFKSADALITNFHLPKTSLIMLVAALASPAKIKTAYKQAIRKKYRFYSFGDAMFIY